MPAMSRRQTRYFLARLTLFYPFPKLCRTLSVSRPTLQRWIDDETRPSLSLLPLFREALSGLIDVLEDHQRKWGFGEEFAEILDDGEEPEYAPQVVPNEGDKVRRWLKRQLETPRKTHDLFREAAEVGFPKARLYSAAKLIGVVKDRKGAGRGSYSIWRLP
jgi:hypothetical protein